MKIEIAKLQDAPALADLFFSHLAAHPEYISHGEIQMGVGEGSVQDGRLIVRTAPDAREKWMEYIRLHLENETIARVWKALSDEVVSGIRRVRKTALRGFLKPFLFKVQAL